MMIIEMLVPMSISLDYTRDGLNWEIRFFLAISDTQFGKFVQNDRF